MEEKSDTPRMGVLVPSAELKRLQRERDEALARVSDLVENGERLKAVADAAVRDTPRSGVLVPSNDLKRLQRERDEARAEAERLRAELFFALRGDGLEHLYDGDCPASNALHARDPRCPACNRLDELTAAEAKP